MNMALDLGASYERLVELEKQLDVHRNGLVNHEAVKQVKQCNSSMHYQYVSLVDNYNGFADVYGKELQRFKTLLGQSVRLQEEVVNAAYQAYTASIASSPAPSPSAVLMNDDNLDNHNAVSNEHVEAVEITSEYMANTAFSAPVVEPAINYGSSCSSNGGDDDDNESVRQIATTNTWTAYGDEQDESKSTTSTAQTSQNTARHNKSTSTTVSSSRPYASIRPTNNNTRKPSNNGMKKQSNVGMTQKSQAKKAPTVSIMAVNNCTSFKYGGKGFDVWKKNGQRAIYQETKLHVTQTFGDDEAGKQKLKRFLVKRAGLKASVIEYVQVVNVPANRRREPYSYGIVTVRDSQQNIERALDALNAGRRESVAWIVYPYQYVNMKGNAVNRKLFVTGFDILSAKDHRAMTQLFLSFGDLACDIVMNKDKNGNPFAVVTYREQRAATACIQYHHGSSTDTLTFNDSGLYIRYYSEEKRNGAKNKNNRNSNNNGRRFRKSN